MRCLLLLVLTLVVVDAADPIAGLQFTDGKSRSAADFAGQHVAILYVCSHCPGSTGFVSSKGKQFANEIEKERLPGHFIVVVPQEKGAGLKAWQKAKGIENALVATDPANKEKISLNNIIRLYYLDAQGKKHAADSDKLLTQGKSFLKGGSYRVSKDGLSDEKALTLWWMLERKRPGAIEPLVKLAKKKGDHQADCQKLLNMVQSSYDAAFNKIQEAGPTIDGYDALEDLILAHAGLDTKAARKLLKSFSKEKALRDELRARTVYKKIQQLLASPKPKDQEQGQAGLTELAKRYPDTKYGKLAASK